MCVPKVKVTNSSDQLEPIRPPMSPESRENQMISLAMNLVEKRLREGTASSQETTHFLKLGSCKAQLEIERLKKENALIEAKTKDYESKEDIKELYANAIKAIQTYSGNGDPDDY